MLLEDNAEPLDALQYLLARMSGVEGEHKRIRANVNGYRQAREDNLRQIAIRMAKRVIDEKKVLAFEPLNPRDRRFVHLVLSEQSGIRTESRGDDYKKRVYIIPD